MFSDNLSLALLKLIDEKNISQETLAEICDLSTRFVGDIIRGHAVPTITTFEKICAGLKLNPNDLLLPEVPIDKLIEKQVTSIRCFDIEDPTTAYPICPSCHTTMERDKQKYCDRCGQRLGWDEYSKAELI